MFSKILYKIIGVIIGFLVGVFTPISRLPLSPGVSDIELLLRYLSPVLLAILGYFIGDFIGNKLEKKIVSEVNKEGKEEFFKEFSWGAFSLNFWWAIFSHLYTYAVLYCIPLINIIIWLYMINNGRKIAWKEGKWKSFEEFQERQLLLDKIGKIVFIIIASLVILSLLVFIIIGPLLK
jgi:uncharacterized protein YacL